MSANQRMSPHRKTVLKVIKKNPYVTSSRIAELTGLTYNSVKHHVEQLTIDDVIHSVAVASEKGGGQWVRKAHCFGPCPDLTLVRSRKVPAQWDVLAHFFGRIAEPVAA
jgi:hypothetical protein